jgi:hypothetical protein
MSSFAPAARFAAKALAVLIGAAATLGTAAFVQNSLGDKALDPNALTPFASSVDELNGFAVETVTPSKGQGVFGPHLPC